MNNVYIIGQVNVPAWCLSCLDAYRSLDGSTKYLFRGYLKDFELNQGDVLEKDGQKIYVRRQK